jgi:muconate cycloisomerase
VPKVIELEVVAADLPFRVPFRHAAASRRRSDSVFVRLRLDNGVDGWGEGLPRRYVTGETVDGAVALLRDRIGPALVGEQLPSLGGAIELLVDCDGLAPASWVAPGEPQAAAWCAVDLALLDAFARTDGRAVADALAGDVTGLPDEPRYSGVASADRGPRALATLAKMRAFGLRQVKLKVDGDHGPDAVRRARRVLGHGTDLRVDVNMGWGADDASARLDALVTEGIRWFEQPVAADDLDTMAALVEGSEVAIVADEGLTTAASLRALIARRACTGVNVRISKCGGLVAALARSREALDAGLELQVGCHVGESSLLSAAHLVLLRALSSRRPGVRYAEGCFGTRLLAEDPVSPGLRFGRGGRPPFAPVGPGFGVQLDPVALDRWRTTSTTVT